MNMYVAIIRSFHESLRLLESSANSKKKKRRKRFVVTAVVTRAVSNISTWFATGWKNSSKEKTNKQTNKKQPKTVSYQTNTELKVSVDSSWTRLHWIHRNQNYIYWILVKKRRTCFKMFHSFHGGYDEFNKLACSRSMGLHSSVGGALQR